MKKNKEDLSTTSPSRITVDYDRKRITITPPKEHLDDKILGGILSFSRTFGKSFILIFAILAVTSFFTLEYYNSVLMPLDMKIDFLGRLTKTYYGGYNIMIAPKIMSIAALASLLYALIAAFLLKYDRQMNKELTLSQRPRYILKIRTTDGQKEWRTPVFYNCCLFYNATGDFSEYLKKIKIRELPCRRIQKMDKKTGRVTKSRKSTSPYWWYGTFIFSKVPVKGTLEVLFK
jgi:hypothetical protein